MRAVVLYCNVALKNSSHHPMLQKRCFFGIDRISMVAKANLKFLLKIRLGQYNALALVRDNYNSALQKKQICFCDSPDPQNTYLTQQLRILYLKKTTVLSFLHIQVQ